MNKAAKNPSQTEPNIKYKNSGLYPAKLKAHLQNTHRVCLWIKDDVFLYRKFYLASLRPGPSRRIARRQVHKTGEIWGPSHDERRSTQITSGPTGIGQELDREVLLKGEITEPTRYIQTQTILAPPPRRLRSGRIVAGRRLP